MTCNDIHPHGPSMHEGKLYTEMLCGTNTGCIFLFDPVQRAASKVERFNFNVGEITCKNLEIDHVSWIDITNAAPTRFLAVFADGVIYQYCKDNTVVKNKDYEQVLLRMQEAVEPFKFIKGEGGFSNELGIKIYKQMMSSK